MIQLPSTGHGSINEEQCDVAQTFVRNDCNKNQFGTSFALPFASSFSFWHLLKKKRIEVVIPIADASLLGFLQKHEKEEEEGKRRNLQGSNFEGTFSATLVSKRKWKDCTKFADGSEGPFLRSMLSFASVR